MNDFDPKTQRLADPLAYPKYRTEPWPANPSLNWAVLDQEPIPWEPGQEGKGYIQNGQVRTWAVNPHNTNPHHSEVAHYYKDPTDQIKEFYMDSAGVVEHYGQLPAEDRRLIKQHHPALKVGDNDLWDFSSKTADYNGWTNWDTWHTALMMDNDQELYNACRKLVENSGTVEQLRDWAIEHVLGPHNRDRIQDAQEWNEIPEEERIDHHYEDLKDKSPEAAGLVDALGFGADVSDDEPTLMDPELVNWQEIYDHLISEQDENAEYEREHDRLKGEGLDFAMPGHTDETNQMLDAWLKHHGAVPDAKWDDPNAEFRLRTTVPAEYLEQSSYWPEEYLTLDTRHKGWKRWPQPEERWKNKEVDWRDPSVQDLVDADPNIQKIRAEGYEKGTRELGWDTLHDIHRGQANPYTDTMRQALEGQGYTPEQVQHIMRQKYYWDPEFSQWKNLEEPPQTTAPDLTQDQPGETTFPESWSSKTAGMTLPQEQRKWQELKDTYGAMTTPVHTFDPYGTNEPWTIHHLPTWPDVHAVGSMLHNCWRGNQEYIDPTIPIKSTPQSYSIHDQYGIPRACFHEHRVKPDSGEPEYKMVNGILGPRNEEVDPDIIAEVRQWNAIVNGGHEGSHRLQDGLQGLDLGQASSLYRKSSEQLTIVPEDPQVIQVPPSGRNHGGGPPFIYSIGTNRVYLGNKGDHHTDIQSHMMGHGEDPNGEKYNDNFVDGRIGGAFSDTTPVRWYMPIDDDSRKRVERVLGTSGASDWTFSAVSPDQMNFDLNDPVVPATQPEKSPFIEEYKGEPDSNWNYEAGRPIIYSPNHNKIFIGAPDELHWGMIHRHPELGELYGDYQPGNPPAVIEVGVPYGRIYNGGKLTWLGGGDDESREIGKKKLEEKGYAIPEENWTFSKTALVTDLNQVDDPYLGSDDPGFMDRIPILYDPDSHDMIIGKPGMYHQSVAEHLGVDEWDYQAGWVKNGKLTWYTFRGDDWSANELRRLGYIQDLPDFNFSNFKKLYSSLRYGEMMWKEASKLEWLKTRGDKRLNTLDGQRFLQLLETRYENEKTDDLMPWLAREWKKDEIRMDTDWNPMWIMCGDQYIITPAMLDHWADWFKSNSPTRRGVDIMQMNVQDMIYKIRDWDEEMKEQMGGAAGTSGETVYQFPDGWTIQELTDAAALKDEGDAMGHCVENYADEVARGHTLIYSLRDDKNEPHATVEIRPNHSYVESGPQYGEMIQIQGKGNEAPKPEYQKRLKEWFNDHESFHSESRPRWDDQYIGDLYDISEPGYATYHPGDYGLDTPNINYDWPSILEPMAGGFAQRGYPQQGVAAHAAQHGKLDELEHEFNEWRIPKSDEWSENWDTNYWNGLHGGWEDAFVHYEEAYPEPRAEDFEDSEGNVDEGAYDQAYKKWVEERDEAMMEYQGDFRQSAWDESDLGGNISDMQDAIAHERYKQRQRELNQPTTFSSTENQNLKWKPGQYGKGLITPEGDVHNWSVDEYSWPHHTEYVIDNGLGRGYDDANLYFYHIQPDGVISDNFGLISPEQNISDQIIKADPRLMIDTPQWRFSHELNWSPGGYGKGLVTPEQEVHTWTTDSDDDENPWHSTYEMLHNIERGQTGMRRFLINPNGKVDEYGNARYTGDISIVPEVDPRLWQDGFDWGVEDPWEASV